MPCTVPRIPPRHIRVHGEIPRRVGDNLLEGDDFAHLGEDFEGRGAAHGGQVGVRALVGGDGCDGSVDAGVFVARACVVGQPMSTVEGVDSADLVG